LTSAQVAEVVGFIDAHRNRSSGGLRWGIEPICEVLEIAPTTYWSAKNRAPCARKIRDAEIGPKVEALWVKNYSVYGRRKMARAVRKAGLDVGRDQVARLMRANGIRGASREKRRFTTHADPAAVRAPDLVKRNFTATGPDQLWVADFTYCSTWSGVVYVAFIVDVYSRRIVGWKAARSMAASLVVDALNMAAWTRRGVDLAGLICHNDAGSQGGIKWWSQHLEVEVFDEQTAGVDGDVDGSTVDEVTGQTADPSRCGAGVLGQDRRRALQRGRRGRVRRIGARRVALVPRTWRDALDQAESSIREVSGVL